MAGKGTQKKPIKKSREVNLKSVGKSIVEGRIQNISKDVILHCPNTYARLRSVSCPKIRQLFNIHRSGSSFRTLKADSFKT
jgi:hypothetical protein